MAETRSGGPMPRRNSSRGELDQIVADVFDIVSAAEAQANYPGAPHRRGRLSYNERDNVIFAQAWPPAPAAGATVPQQQVWPQAWEPDDPHAEPDLVDPGAQAIATPETGPDLLLNEEEESFINNAVAWLAARANPDILLERIWNLLLRHKGADEGNAEPASEQNDTIPDGAGEESTEEP